MSLQHLAVSLQFIVLSSVAWAACLEGHLSVSSELKKSHAVFIGVVEAERLVPETSENLDGTAYSVKIEELLHGTLPQRVELFSENSSGRFLLQKGRVLRFEKQVGAMLLNDMTIIKFMLSAILVGMVGITLLTDAGIITSSHKAMNVGAVVIGGALFGCGWAVMGFCPGTSIGALGEGRWHAVFAIVGMVVGAALYAELYPFFKSTVLAWKDFGKIGLPEALGVSPWVIIPFLWAGTILLFYWFEKKGL